MLWLNAIGPVLQSVLFHMNLETLNCIIFLFQLLKGGNRNEFAACGLNYPLSWSWNNFSFMQRGDVGHLWKHCLSWGCGLWFFHALTSVTRLWPRQYYWCVNIWCVVPSSLVVILQSVLSCVLWCSLYVFSYPLIMSSFITEDLLNGPKFDARL